MRISDWSSDVCSSDLRNDDAYICARSIQCFAPGIPEVYYVGLLAGQNDHELMEETGELRDINRHYYSKEEIAEAVKQPVVRRLFALMEFRSSYPAFNGVFHLQYSNDSNVAMCWRDGTHTCELFVDLTFKKATVRYIDRSEEHTSELQ